MSTPIASEVAADEGSVKQVSQKLIEKRCRDCRKEKSGSQGNLTQNYRATLKSGIAISRTQECELVSVRVVEEKYASGAKGLHGGVDCDGDHSIWFQDGKNAQD
jgi:hypothetical protein